MKTKTQCPECGRVFDLTDEADAEEWTYGHDCEEPDPNTPEFHIENHWVVSETPFGDLLEHLYEEHGTPQPFTMDNFDTLVTVHAAKHAGLEWREDDLGMLEDAGDVGGDLQAGPAFSRRFIFGPVEDNYMVIEEYAYAEELDVDEDDDRHGGFGASEMAMFTICTDLEDVGGSEVASDVHYGEGGYLVHDTVEKATAEARRLMERNDLPTYYDPIEELAVGRFRR